jgi:PPIC-type PPIASE domain
MGLEISTAFKRLLKEPLVHFLALALAIFLADHVLNPATAERTERLVVTQAKIEQLAGLFSKTWQRPPTPTELKGLIDSYVKEEIYYREALKLGLDKGDTVIRRRLHQKMQFFTDTLDQSATPTDEELVAYLESHAEKYNIEPQVAFVQVFFNPDRRGTSLDSDIADALHSLRDSPPADDPTAFGDTTILPERMDSSPLSIIARTFGSKFAEAVGGLTEDTWTGPVESSFGLHLVRVLERQPGRKPTLDEVRAALTRDWTNDKRMQQEAAFFAELLKKYEVAVEEPPQQGIKTAKDQ